MPYVIRVQFTEDRDKPETYYLGAGNRLMVSLDNAERYTDPSKIDHSLKFSVRTHPAAAVAMLEPQQAALDELAAVFTIELGRAMLEAGTDPQFVWDVIDHHPQPEPLWQGLGWSGDAAKDMAPAPTYVIRLTYPDGEVFYLNHSYIGPERTKNIKDAMQFCEPPILDDVIAAFPNAKVDSVTEDEVMERIKQHALKGEYVLDTDTPPALGDQYDPPQQDRRTIERDGVRYRCNAAGILERWHPGRSEWEMVGDYTSSTFQPHGLDALSWPDVQAIAYYWPRPQA